MRLYDALLRTPSERWFTGDMPVEYMTAMGELLPSSVHVEISNVVQYCDTHSHRNGNFIHPWDVPSVKLPFPAVWMEWDDAPFLSGMLLWEDDAENEEIAGLVFIHQSSGAIVIPALIRYRCRRDTGEYIRDSLSWERFGDIFKNDAEERYAEAGLFVSISSVTTAIGFMHCKNVVLEDAPPSGTRQQRRLEQRQGIEQTQFKTLVIEPMKQVLRTEGNIEQHGLKKALHICRGHFATYSEDKPLFGRYSGTFWRPAHVRGSAEAGTVYKDYKVKPPKAS